MKYLLILSLFLVGCSTSIPVKRTFPAVPKELTTKCPDLKQLPADTEKLSDLIANVAENYSTYKECQLTVELWNEWYTEQKKNFDSVK
jgi:hypothetical protein